MPKEKRTIFSHGQPMTIEVDALKTILYKLRPLLPDETRTNRVSAVDQAYIDISNLMEQEVNKTLDSLPRQVHRTTPKHVITCIKPSFIKTIKGAE